MMYELFNKKKTYKNMRFNSYDQIGHKKILHITRQLCFQDL